MTSVLPSVIWALALWTLAGSLACIAFMRYRWSQEKRAAHRELEKQASHLADGYERLSRCGTDDAARLLYTQASEYWAGVALYYAGKSVPRSSARRAPIPPPQHSWSRGNTRADDDE
jgi:hypothetical protein